MRPGDVIRDRYRILSELGSGGMGVVYRAHDDERGVEIALKTLARVDSDALYVLKREFRSLADVVHPNLVRLHDLVADDERCFYTMELVDGVDFLRHVRPPPAAEDDTASGLPVDLKTLRRALAQLAVGVSALHDAGKLHRDLKPTNVLVTHEGRVVVLDFGLVTELEPEDSLRTTGGGLSGTVPYMAPEQAGGEDLTPAADWYSVGVMLFEALAGRRPFVGKPLEILVDKQRYDPPAPSELATGVPGDLDALCVDLLRRDPARRPDAREVLRRVGIELETTGETSPATPARAPSGPGGRFVGREAELAELRRTFDASRAGHPAVAFVRGPSGIGKTALIRHFVEGPREVHHALVLAGSCHEQELVPYKAFDQAIDRLARFLRKLPASEVQAILPRDVAPLERLFPVLGRVPAVLEAPRRSSATTDDADPQELRRRGVAALRELLGRLGDRRPLILLVDDLQWMDADSARLLSHLVRPPDPPALFVLGSYRSDEVDANPSLRAITGSGGLDLPAGPTFVTLSALERERSEELARSLIGGATEADRARARAVADEAGGIPFFIDQLSRATAWDADGEQAPPPALDRLVADRIASLPPGERALLELLAVAGRPVAEELALEASGQTGETGHRALASLRTASLLRTLPEEDRKLVAPYHDRIRESVLLHLASEDRLQHHGALASALARASDADPEDLALHHRAAGRVAEATRWEIEAGDRAAAALAFDRAATAFRRALEDGALEPSLDLEVRTRLGRALADAGRGAEAAVVFLGAAERATGDRALDLEHRAADQLLRSGQGERGLARIRRVLGALEVPLPRTAAGGLLGILGRGLVLRIRGLGFRERAEEEIDPRTLRRLDACWAGSVTLPLVVPIAAANLQMRHLALALRTGEPYRLARALGLHVAIVSAPWGPSRPEAECLLATADELAERADSDHARGLLDLARGVLALDAGRWAEALPVFDRGHRTLRERCTGVAWEVQNAFVLVLSCLEWMGELGEMRTRLGPVLALAREQRAAYAVMTFRYYEALVRLADDRPDEAERETREAFGELEGTPHSPLRRFEPYRLCQIALYDGRPADVPMILGRLWRAAALTPFFAAPLLKAGTLDLTARASLGQALREPLDRARHLRDARRDADRMLRVGSGWSTALAQLIRSGVAHQEDRLDDARRELEGAVEGLEEAHMDLHAAAARWRLGSLLGGDEGAALRATAEDWFRARGFRNPTRWVDALAPGHPD